MNTNPAVPACLQNQFDAAWRHYQEALSQCKLTPQQQAQLQRLSDDAKLYQQLVRVWVGSEFAARQSCRKPELLLELLASGELEREHTDGEVLAALQASLAEVTSDEQLAIGLRSYRNREMVRIIWRDQLGLADLRQTTLELSTLADSCIQVALDWLYADTCRSLGTPGRDKQRGSGPDVGAASDTEARTQGLVVLGMGKLGAQELNLSSDIDLIFAFENQGETQGGARRLDNQQFYTRLGQRLIQVLDTHGTEGFVFRVDMRLRPYGDSGALALNFDAMSEYYQTQGRDWERYAWIKARVVAGDKAAGARLLQELRPFVYRRYLDFSAIEALRDMKRLIRREEQRRGLQQDIKLGPGGIREIEFIVQAFQLIWGGRDSRLQRRELLQVLPLLAEVGLLPAEVVERLAQAYVFLRQVEHRLQAVRDEQTQKLPADELECSRLAFSLGYDNWDVFARALQEQRDYVQQQFGDLIAEPEQRQVVEDHWQALWRQELSPAEALELLETQGFEDAKDSHARLAALYQSRKIQALQSIAQQRLDEFMAVLLASLAGTEKPSRTLQRLLTLVEAVVRRTAYLVLLVENPAALEQLIRLCAASPWIADELAHYPVLLDELIDTRALYQPADPQALLAELRQQLLRIDPEDMEQQMEALRHFKRAHVLRVAASEVTGALPLMKVSDYLTFIAEAVLKEVLQLAWQHLCRKHGAPGHGAANETSTSPDFIVVGYGKLGGLELSYGSDLDLVFIHDAPNEGISSGPQPIENPVFYSRLVQRMVHMMTTHTPSGQLYDIDMRLRPSGASGLLVTSLVAFAQYQAEQAWTWEHQALVRARVIAGSERVAGDFVALRNEVLAGSLRNRQLDLQALRREVVTMREKISVAHLGSQAAKALQAGAEADFDLKYAPGGIVDIEFIVQYAVLAWSHQYPALLEFTDNIRILDGLEAAQLIAAEDAALLREAYIAFRSAVHRLTIDQQPSRLSAQELQRGGYLPLREAVMRMWRALLLDPQK